MPLELLDAPNTYIFALAPIQRKLGDRWEQLGPSVHRIAKRMLFSRLDGKGTFQRFDDTYVITFDSLSGEQAQSAGKKIYEQFTKLLFHGQGADDLTKGQRIRTKGEKNSHPGRKGFFSRMFARLTTPFRSKDGGGSAPEMAFAESGTSAATNGSAYVGGDKALHSGRRNFAPGRAANRSGKAKGFYTNSTDLNDPDAGWQSPYQPKNLRETLNLLREARAIENAMAAEVLSRIRAWSDEMANRNFPPPDLSFLYRSMWNLKSEYLTTYTSVPICWKNGMEVYHGEDVVPPPRRPENLLALDLLSLENTIEILDRFIKQKRRVLFMTSVHASTLASAKTLQEYLAVAESIPKPARRNLIFEIVDIGNYANTREAIQMVKHLSPYARAVSASVRLDDRNFAFWKRCGFMAVGADLSRDQRSETEIINHLAYFAPQAKRNKLLSYLRELDKRSLAITALSYGFDFLEGAVIGSGDDPDHLVLSEFRLDNLYNDEPEVVWAD